MEIDIDIDDIIMSCSKREKKDLYKALLEDGDVLVLVSDGVSQRFEGDTLSAVINNAPGVNPQKLADLLLAEAEKRQGAPEDDMTVAVCRIFKRIS